MSAADKVKLNGIETAADVTDAGNIATAINAVAETTPLDADEFPFYKAVGTALKKVLWSTIKSTLKTYFDTLYLAIGGTAADSDKLDAQHGDYYKINTTVGLYHQNGNGDLAVKNGVWTDLYTQSITVPAGQTWNITVISTLSGYIQAAGARGFIRSVIDATNGQGACWQSYSAAGGWGTTTDVLQVSKAAGTYTIKSQYTDDNTAIKSGQRTFTAICVRTA
jgi:hypothetical protein